MSAENPSESAVVVAAPHSPLAPVTATTKASRHQALTSSTAAQASAIVPTRVRMSFRSVRMRARTGKAVTLMAVPRNSVKGSRATPSGASSA